MAGTPTLSCARDGVAYLLRFHGCADFHVSADPAEVWCPASRIDGDRLGLLIVDDLLPLALSAAGRLVLHASAVLTGDGVIAFIGATGAGKSTLAASLANAGCAPLADDWFVVEVGDRGLVAVAGIPVWKLRQDSAHAVFGQARCESASAPQENDKERIETHSGWAAASEPLPVQRIYVLVPHNDPEESISIRPLSAREAFLALVCHSFGIDIDDATHLRASADRFAAAALAPVWCALRIPRRLGSLAAVHQAIVPPLGRPRHLPLTHGVA